MVVQNLATKIYHFVVEANSIEEAKSKLRHPSVKPVRIETEDKYKNE